MKIAIGSDHAGFEMKEFVESVLKDLGHEVKDFGTGSEDSCDYPDFAHPVAEAVSQGEFPLGVLLCGSGNGICMTANKHQDIRAALAWNGEISKMARAHNNANILCLPARYISREEAKLAVEEFLSTEFEGGRHQRRVEKIPAN